MDPLNTRNQNKTIPKRSYGKNILLLFQSNEKESFLNATGEGNEVFNPVEPKRGSTPIFGLIARLCRSVCLLASRRAMWSL